METTNQRDFRGGETDLLVVRTTSRREKYADAPEPDLVFLDRKLEQTTGRDVLEPLESDQPRVPVVVLTGSKASLETDRSPTERADLLRKADRIRRIRRDPPLDRSRS